MGYTTEFEGAITITPTLNEQEITFLRKFFTTRRMQREGGPYFVDGEGFFGQGNGPDKVYDHNRPPKGQPGLWCNYEVSDDGTQLFWSGTEKSYNMDEWLGYLIQHFIGAEPDARIHYPEDFDFLQGHTLNGQMEAQGEETEDRWLLEVEDNIVRVRPGHIVYED